MSIINNFPSAPEKVSIDGAKVTEKKSLSSISNAFVVSDVMPESYCGVSAPFEYNNKLYIHHSTVTSNTFSYSALDEEIWETATDGINSCPYPGSSIAVLDNELHVISDTYHSKWNGTSWTALSSVSIDSSDGSILSIVSHSGKLYGITSTGSFYLWDSSNDTWTKVVSSSYTPASCIVSDGSNIWYISNVTSSYSYLMKFDGTSVTLATKVTQYVTSLVSLSDGLYILESSKLYGDSIDTDYIKIYKYTDTLEDVGRIYWTTHQIVPSNCYDEIHFVLSNLDSDSSHGQYFHGYVPRKLYKEV